MTDSPTKTSASLLDASEKPLRRLGSGEKSVEWPVLVPNKPSSPNSLQTSLRESGQALKDQISSQGERYPKLGDITGQSFSEEHLPVSRYSSLADPAPDEKHFSLKAAHTSSIHQHYTDDIPHGSRIQPNPTDLSVGSIPPKSPLRLSAQAASLEKASEEFSISSPRQTRTSSLRARLSTGQLVKDGQYKVTGFTDFTAQPMVSSVHRRDSYRARKEAQARSSTSTISTRQVNISRPPAQFIAGSRRPNQHRRSVSRASNGIESQNSNPSSGQASHLVPVKENIKTADGPYPIIKRQVKTRKSSIPLPNHVKTKVEQRSHHPVVTSQADRLNPKKRASNEFEIFQDRSSADYSGVSQNGKQQSRAGTSSVTSSETSPHQYHMKRLSNKAPAFGPSLKISRSAERLIMGPDSDKENIGIGKSDTKSSTPKGAILGSLRNSRTRPLSSQGVLQSSPHRMSTMIDQRSKKAKSVDLTLALPIQSDAKSTPSRQSTTTSTQASSNDPFFDAREEISTSTQTTPKPLKQNLQISPIDEATWISPLSPRIAEHHIGPSQAADASPFEKGDLAEESQALLPANQKTSSEVEITETTKSVDQPKHLNGHLKQSKTTPVPGKVSRPDLPSHPPRSSSRAAPNYNSKASPVGMRAAAQTPPKDFIRRQNNLGFQSGLGSSQLDLNKVRNNRDSVARESSKSHTSVSRTVLSNFRGLFHKRSSDTPELRKGTQSKGKNKTSNVDATGSPIPSSLIHPAYRADSSTPRNHTATPNPTGNPKINTTTPSLVSPAPTEVSSTTTLAMRILDSARTERSPARREQLLELGKIMVDAITHARDAEKAMEEAKQAARKAELASAKCQGTLKDVTRIVEGWKEEGEKSNFRG